MLHDRIVRDYGTESLNGRGYDVLPDQKKYAPAHRTTTSRIMSEDEGDFDFAPVAIRTPQV